MLRPPQGPTNFSCASASAVQLPHKVYMRRGDEIGQLYAGGTYGVPRLADLRAPGAGWTPASALYAHISRIYLKLVMKSESFK